VFAQEGKSETTGVDETIQGSRLERGGASDLCTSYTVHFSWRAAV